MAIGGSGVMHGMIFGCGYSGTAIAKAFAGSGNRIAGTTRSPEKAALLRQEGIEAFLFDGDTLSEPLRQEMAAATHLVHSIAPGKAGDPLVRLFGTDIRTAMPKLRWIGYLSTVGVYGDHKGAWVDEETPLHPVSDRSVERVAAEEAWLAIGEAIDIPVAILRLAGIYGPGRNAFCNLDKGTARRLVKKEQVFNRIRVEDIGGAARFLSDHGLGGLYNVTDDEPGPPQDVIAEAARLMGVEPPPETPFETAELSPMARSFYGENKRVSNRRLRAAGFDFAYPNYRMSLQQLWSSGIWRG
jgi:nucleoside-diphosphate-sugar epimerase